MSARPHARGFPTAADSHWGALCRAARRHAGADLRPTPTVATDPGWAGPDARRRLDETLALVHRSEQARLLRDAAALRIVLHRPARLGASTEADRWLALVLEVARIGGWSDWCGDMRNAVELAREDGVTLPVELIACGLEPPERWGGGSVRALLEASEILDPDPVVGLLRATRALARGRLRRAEVLARETLAQPWIDLASRPTRLRARLELTRALSLWSLATCRATGGRPTSAAAPARLEALRVLARARRDWRGRDRVRLAALELALALAAGAPRVARRAARRLNEVPPRIAGEVGSGLAADLGSPWIRPVGGAIPETSAPLAGHLLASSNDLAASVVLAVLARGE